MSITASGDALNPVGKQSLNGRIGWSYDKALNTRLGTIALNLMSVCNSPRWISLDVSFGRFSRPGTGFWSITPLLILPASFNRRWTSILAQNAEEKNR